MFPLPKFIVVFCVLFSIAFYAQAKESSGNSPFEELLNYQERALMNAFVDKKIVINGFRSPNIFSGYVPFKENQKFKVEVRLANRMVACVERIPGVNRQVCVNEAVLNIAQGDDKSSAKRYLVVTVSYFKRDDKEEPELLFYSYRYAQDKEDLFASWDMDKSALKKHEKKIRPVFMKFDPYPI